MPATQGVCQCKHKRTVSGVRCGDCGKPVAPKSVTLQNGDPDWKTPCTVCGEKPTLHPTELCGPCCTGESDTYGGNW